MTIYSQTPAVLRCCCSRCQGSVTFATVEEYLAHSHAGITTPSTQLSLFPAIVPPTPWP